MCVPPSCAHATASCAGETVTSNLSNLWLGLVTAGTEWRFPVGALPRVCQFLDSGETVCQDSKQLPRLGGTVMASQNSVLGQEEFVSCDRV